MKVDRIEAGQQMRSGLTGLTATPVDIASASLALPAAKLRLRMGRKHDGLFAGRATGDTARIGRNRKAAREVHDILVPCFY
jgi:hypothetical protein